MEFTDYVVVLFLSPICATEADLETVDPLPKPGNFQIAVIGRDACTMFEDYVQVFTSSMVVHALFPS